MQLNTVKDICDAYEKVASKKQTPQRTSSSYTYAFPRIPNGAARAIGDEGVPNIALLKPIR
jgi:hypothetical protein